jgi:hypothetical protein
MEAVRVSKRNTSLLEIKGLQFVHVENKKWEYANLEAAKILVSTQTT